MPLEKKKLRLGAKSSTLHAAREVVLDDGEAVAQGEGELADRVRAGFGDVITADRHRVEVAHLVVDEVLLDVAHHAQREFGAEDAGVLRLVLFEDVGLHGAAHVLQGELLDARVGFRIDQFVAGDAEQAEAEAFVTLGQIAVVLRALHVFVDARRSSFRRRPSGRRLRAGISRRSGRSRCS
jgi:hypothetical protein